MSKGVELYSWLDPVGDKWRFSLLPGTNRNKTTAEITAPERTIESVEALKQQLARLAVGEYVFWTIPDPKRFSYPPQAVIADISQTATAQQLHFSTPKP